MKETTALDVANTLISAGWKEFPSGTPDVLHFGMYRKDPTGEKWHTVPVLIRVYCYPRDPNCRAISVPIIGLDIRVRAQLPDTSWAEIVRDHVPGDLPALMRSAQTMFRLFDAGVAMWCPA